MTEMDCDVFAMRAFADDVKKDVDWLLEKLSVDDRELLVLLKLPLAFAALMMSAAYINC